MEEDYWYILMQVCLQENFHSNLTKEIEAKANEVNQHKVKWLLIGIYRPPSSSKTYFIEEMCRHLEIFFAKYGNFTIGDNYSQ